MIKPEPCVGLFHMCLQIIMVTIHSEPLKMKHWVSALDNINIT